MIQKRIIGYSILVLLAAGALFGIMNLRSEKNEQEVLPPKLSSISAEYVTSTDEVVIRWNVDNIDISELNTGVRYATSSHATTSSLTSETYPAFEFSKRVDSQYEARIDVSSLETLYYRIQVAHNNEFLWSDEGEVLVGEFGSE